MRPNLLDALEILIFAAVVIRGYKSSFFVELFKLIAVYVSVVIATHYYIALGSILAKWIVLVKPMENAIAFGLLATTFSLLFPFVREGWVNIINIEPKPPVKSWLNACLAILRGYLICGIIFFTLVVSNNEYFTNLTRTSFSKFVFKDVCIDVYRLTYNIFIQGFFSSEHMNKDAIDAVENNFQPVEDQKKSAK